MLTHGLKVLQALRPLLSHHRHQLPRPFSWACPINRKALKPAIVLEAWALQVSHRAVESVKQPLTLSHVVMLATPATE